MIYYYRVVSEDRLHSVFRYEIVQDFLVKSLKARAYLTQFRKNRYLLNPFVENTRSALLSEGVCRKDT